MCNFTIDHQENCWFKDWARELPGGWGCSVPPLDNGFRASIVVKSNFERHKS